MSRETHYDVLGAPRTSTDAELKQAYRRALRTSHPDLGGTAEQFRIVQAAWAVLGNALRRAEYDRLYMPQASTPPRSPAPPKAPGPTQGSTRRERSQSRRSAEQPRPRAEAKPTYATVHGHPGGSSRARYVDVAREWMLSPTTPTPPAKPPRITHQQDRFLHMWGVVFLQLAVGFGAILGVLVLIGVWSGSVPTDAAWPIWRAVAVSAANLSFLGGGVIAVMRLATSHPRGEVRRMRAANRNLYAEAVRQFETDVANRPNDPSAFLRSPFAASSVLIAPARARAHFERALAQEAVATVLTSLNAEFTVWHDVLVGREQVYASHLVVGPQGLFLVEPLQERSRVDAWLLAQLADAIGVAGITGVLFVDLDAAAVNAPPAKLGERPTLTWRVGTNRLAALLGGGIHGVDRGEDWEVRQLVDRVARRVVFA